MSALDGTAPLAVVERGGRVESVHDGAVAVVDADGSLVAWAGSPGLCAFTRSALKPLQAFPFVAAGGPKHFGLSSEQVALLCASHSGEAKHQVAVADLLRRAGVAPDELGCGTHAPYVYDTLHEAPPPPPYSPLGHNCSGKHAGMLALAKAEGWPTAGYERREHPLQQLMLRTVAECCVVPAATIPLGVDGCSVPVFGLPLAAMALGYARLAAAMARGGDARAQALQRIGRAMVAEPVTVEGEGRLATDIMLAGRGRLLAKSGAEGLLLVAEPGTGRGIAIKCEDGAMRAVGPAAVELLLALGTLEPRDADSLNLHRRPPVHDAAGHPVGLLEARVSVVVSDDVRA